MKVEPDWLRAVSVGRPVGVDREGTGKLLGYVVAQEGPFKSEGRGEFDRASLATIVKLGNAARGGLKSRFTHPDMSSDGLGKFLGRSQNFTLGTVRSAEGKTVQAVRADLHFDASAHETPSGDLAGYILKLAESDPDALSSSLVLQTDEEQRLEKDGTAVCGPDGEPLPPLWRPKKLHASDIVDTGEAVDGLLSAQLSADGLPLRQLWQGAELLDQVFADQPREVIQVRLLAYLDRYLTRRFGAAVGCCDLHPGNPKLTCEGCMKARQDSRPPTPQLDARRLKLDEMALEMRRQG